MEMPENIFNKFMLYLSHPIADIFKERCNCLIEKIKDVPELAFHRVYFIQEHTQNYSHILKTIQRNKYMKYIFKHSIITRLKTIK